MNRQHRAILFLAGLLAIVVVVFLVWCPPAACRALNIHTYTISKLDEYRHFLTDETAFSTLHRVRAVRLDCSALRHDVATNLGDGRLTLGVSKPSVVEGNSAQPRQFQAWHQGRVLHLASTMSESQQELDAWAVRVQEMISEQQHDELFFLPRLFGGLIIHVHKKQIPIVLFSDKPCA